MFSLILWLWVIEVRTQQEEPYRWQCVHRHHISPLTTHGGFGDVSMKRSARTIPFLHIMSFSCNSPSFTWVALSIPVPTLNHHSLLPSTIPFRRIAPELTGLDPPLRVFTAALLAAFESSQPVLEAQRGKIKLLKAGSDHR